MSKIDPELDKAMAAARNLTRWFGVVNDQQAKTIKLNLMLLTGSSQVTVYVDLEAKHVKYDYVNGDPVIKYQVKASSLVQSVLGPDWTVECGTISVNDTGTTRKSKNTVDRNRTRSPKQGSKKPRK